MSSANRRSSGPVRGPAPPSENHGDTGQNDATPSDTTLILAGVIAEAASISRSEAASATSPRESSVDQAENNTQGIGVLVAQGRVVSLEDPANLSPAARELDASAIVDLGRDTLLLPGMVNAHTHLDLTALGPVPYEACGGSFIDWIRRVIRDRPRDAEAVAASFAEGARRCAEAGVVAVGDIFAGDDSTMALQTLAAHGLGGVVFRELIGMSDETDLDASALLPGIGLQPHAPYSASPGLYAQAVAHAEARPAKGEPPFPLATHLAETREEAQLVAEGRGPFRELLEQRGLWREDLAAVFGQGQSPIQHLAPILRRAPFLVAHVNYASDDDLNALTQTETCVAYCPIASGYFGHGNANDPESPPHRYRAMQARGIRVCLGTDSILNTRADDPHPLGLIAALRLLYQRDRTDPSTLLAMATTHGAAALGLDRTVGTFRAGAPARFLAYRFDPSDSNDPLTQMLSGLNTPENRVHIIEGILRRPATPASF